MDGRYEILRPLLKPPARLCCGQRHYGVICPDGKVMCCLCFERFTVDELSETVDGDKQDVCRACDEKERAWR